MHSVANKRILWITETAVMTALLIVLQTAAKAGGQYVTGSCVNAVLAVSVLAVWMVWILGTLPLPGSFYSLRRYPAHRQYGWRP